MGNSRIDGYYAYDPACGCVIGAFVLENRKSAGLWASRFVRQGLILVYTDNLASVKLVDCSHSQKVLSERQLRLDFGDEE